MKKWIQRIIRKWQHRRQREQAMAMLAIRAMITGEDVSWEMQMLKEEK